MTGFSKAGHMAAASTTSHEGLVNRKPTLWATAFYGACLALVAAAPVAAIADDEMPVTYKGSTLDLGGLHLTPGGFIAAESVYRTRNEVSDINSAFTSYAFRDVENYGTGEFRASARQSRVQLLAQGPGDSINKVEAFIAADFLSSGTTSNQNQSNSYTLRMREAYAQWTRTDADLYVLAGQTWSLATLNKKGLTPRQEDIPLTIDAQYVMGFNWLRTPQFRVVKNFGTMGAVGISFENPQNQVKGTVPAGGDVNNSGTGGGLLNNTTTYSTDIAPDMTVKFALDPGWGHYEIYSLTRFFHDRADSTPGDQTSVKNNTTVAESIGGGLILPVVPKMLDVQFSGLIGHGGGRYASATLGDSTVSTKDGSLQALKSKSGLVGVIAHPSPILDAYLYAGEEHSGSGFTYGNGVGDNSGCNVSFADVTSTTGKCTNAIETAKELTGGFWWKAYKGAIGYVNIGAQLEYAKLETFKDAKGITGDTNDTTVMLSFRYYPYQ